MSAVVGRVRTDAGRREEQSYRSVRGSEEGAH